MSLMYVLFTSKGKDDLRQDAVMQQVFGMVNILLQKNVETRKRNLKIRTYKVRFESFDNVNMTVGQCNPGNM